jgi:branched-chain amino acid transport system permease protein
MTIAKREISKGETVCKTAVLVGLAFVFSIIPLFLSTYGEGLLTRFLIFALFAMSYNIIFGYTGLLSLGHAAFFGAGGYTVALLKLHYDIDLFWASAPLALFVAAFTAALFGIVALRAHGIYFLLVTFALGQMLFSLAWNIKWFNSRGMQGITGIPLPDLGIPGFVLDRTQYYYIVLICFVVSAFVLNRFVRSPFGKALTGIREGELRMKALGYNTWLYKYLAFIISGGFAGLAGVLFCYYNFFISPNHLGIATSFVPMVMAIMGGLGTFFGPVIGAAVFILIENFASILAPQRWPLILGTVFVLTIMFARDGIGVYLWKVSSKITRLYGSTQN